MGFLKKNKVPDELPELAIEGLGNSSFQDPLHAAQPQGAPISSPIQKIPENIQRNLAPGIDIPARRPQNPSPQVRGEDYLEFSHDAVEVSHKAQENLPTELLQGIEHDPDLGKPGFFDDILKEVNGEAADLGKIEELYRDKFLGVDVVSGVKDYWEGNKTDIVIRSFGAEYKKKINEKIKKMQELETDWKGIYIQLVKKEEEMKKEEYSLKKTLSEFVELCERRKTDDAKEEK